MTTAYTTVLVDNYTGWCGVFFGEQFAYMILNPTQLFWEDLKNENMCEKGSDGKYWRKQL